MAEISAASAFAKLARAKVLYSELLAYLEEAFSEMPLDPFLEHERGSIYQVKLAELPNPPLGLAVGVGEIIQHFRSALDHAVYSIAETVGTPPSGTEFPIFIDESEFRRNVKRKTRGLPASTVERIEAWQPYRGLLNGQRPGQQMLWLMHQLSNADKHRNLNLAIVAVRVKSLQLESGMGSARVVEIYNDVWLDARAVLGKVEVTDQSEEFALKLEVERGIAFRDVAIPEVEQPMVMPLLELFGQIATSIVKDISDLNSA